MQEEFIRDTLPRRDRSPRRKKLLTFALVEINSPDKNPNTRKHSPDGLSGNMLVKTSSKVALQQLVVIDGLGYDPADKPKVAKMFRVVVRELVDGVGDPVLRCSHKQCIVWVKYLTRHDQVPFSQ